MSCSATPDNPCFCRCHTILDFEGEPLKGCDDCPKFEQPNRGKSNE